MGLFRIEISKRRLILAKHLHFGIGYQTFGYRFFPEVPYWWVEADLRSCQELGFDALITLAVLGKLDENASSFSRKLTFLDSSPLFLSIFAQGIGEGRSDCAVLVVDICNPDSFKAAVTRGAGKYRPFLVRFVFSFVWKMSETSR